jgi:hypothetical protein
MSIIDYCNNYLQLSDKQYTLYKDLLTPLHATSSRNNELAPSNEEEAFLLLLLTGIPIYVELLILGRPACGRLNFIPKTYIDSQKKSN